MVVARVTVPVAYRLPVDRAVVEARPRLVLPVTARVPPIVALPKVVEVPTVNVSIVEYVLVKLVVNRLVEVELVITEVEAKMFCTNRSLNLYRALPSV